MLLFKCLPKYNSSACRSVGSPRQCLPNTQKCSVAFTDEGLLLFPCLKRLRVGQVAQLILAGLARLGNRCPGLTWTGLPPVPRNPSPHCRLKGRCDWWGTQVLLRSSRTCRPSLGPGSGLTLTLCHVLSASARHRASPDARAGEIDAAWNCRVTCNRTRGEGGARPLAFMTLLSLQSAC